MSKSKASKTRGCAAWTGIKSPEKARYDSKKMLTGTAIPSEQMDNNLQLQDNRMLRRMQG